MKALTILVSALLLVACGSDKSTGGMAGASGLGGTSASAGTMGTAGGGGAAGQGGAGGNAQSCLQIEADYVAAIVGARLCDVNAGVARCTHPVSSALSCGCQIWVNDTTELDTIHDQWTAAGCTPGIVSPGDRLSESRHPGACVPASSGDCASPRRSSNAIMSCQALRATGPATTRRTRQGRQA